MDDEALIQFFSNLPAYKIKPHGACRHFFTRRMVDTTLRKITCGTCGDELNAFDCLAEMALKHEQIAESVKRMKTERETLRVRIEELKREEYNARSRLGRLRAKDRS